MPELQRRSCAIDLRAKPAKVRPKPEARRPILQTSWQRQTASHRELLPGLEACVDTLTRKLSFRTKRSRVNNRSIAVMEVDYESGRCAGAGSAAWRLSAPTAGHAYQRLLTVFWLHIYQPESS